MPKFGGIMKKFSDYIHNIREEPEQKAPGCADVLKGRFQIRKSDNEKMQAFGWASVAIEENGEQLEDWQGDIIDPEDLEQAAYEFVQFYGNGGEMHQEDKRIVAKLIESMVFTEEKTRLLGIPDGVLPVGWWIGFQVQDEDVWEKVKNGTYSMFSIEGEACRIPV